MIIEKNDTLLMIGDSVTDVGRTQPVGEGLFNALGSGYPMFVRALLESAYPELNVRTTNMGTNGHNVRDLDARWQRDVLDRKPDWVTVMIGINDVWRQFDCPGMPENHVPLDEYERTLQSLVERTLPSVKGMLVMTPYYMEPLRADPMRARMDEYGQAAKRVAEKTGCMVLDTQALFDGLLAHMHSANIAWDRVHPNATGHMLLARNLLKCFGFDR